VRNPLEVEPDANFEAGSSAADTLAAVRRLESDVTESYQHSEDDDNRSSNLVKAIYVFTPQHPRTSYEEPVHDKLTPERTADQQEQTCEC